MLILDTHPFMITIFYICEYICLFSHVWNEFMKYVNELYFT